MPTDGEITWEDLGASQEMREALVESAVFLHLFSPEMVTDPGSDPRPFLQLGVAIMLDKPVIVMAERADESIIPAHLLRVADRIVLYERGQLDASVAEALAEAMKSLAPED